VTSPPPFDLDKAHHWFAAGAFNATWDLLKKERRSPDEDRQMILLAMTSLYHWTQREDCTDQNMSIGYWQVSRVHAVLGLGGEARRYGELCFAYSGGLDAFYLGYAHEALARAAVVQDNLGRAIEHASRARALSVEVTDEEGQEWLVADLDEIDAMIESWGAAQPD
jgi:hypothetical protein